VKPSESYTPPHTPRTGAEWLTLLLVGLVAGVLASFIVGGIGYGILGDMIVGVVGAFVGGWLFGRFRWRTPFAGIGGTIFVAFVGALLLLLILNALRTAR
jgi:uncharacterized membrane protein YeaQ/YmgE (transglycosylase-associated protein family)